MLWRVLFHIIYDFLPCDNLGLCCRTTAVSVTKMIQHFGHSQCFLCEPLRLFVPHFNVTWHVEYFPVQTLSTLSELEGIRCNSLSQGKKKKKKDSLVLLQCQVLFTFNFSLYWKWCLGTLVKVCSGITLIHKGCRNGRNSWRNSYPSVQVQG